MSKIEWTDATWNPVRGCSRISEGCRHCYAERMAARFAKECEPFAGFVWAGKWTGRVELVPEKLDEPLRWRKPRRVFVNSMSDLFHESLSDEAIAAVFAVMSVCPQHTFQILTKRPERMRRWFDGIDSRAGTMNGLRSDRLYILREAASRYLALGKWPTDVHADGMDWPLPNVWLGVSVEDQKTADERVPLLLQTPATTRFVSYEPALGPADFAPWLSGPECPYCGSDAAVVGLRSERAEPGQWYCRRPGCTEGFGAWGLDLVIVGGESGPGARPCDVAWIRSAVQQCREAGVACFTKQWGSRPVEDGRPIRLRSAKGGDPSEWGDGDWPRELPNA